VTVGVRPEDLDGPIPETDNTVEMRVSVLEQLGHTLLVYGYVDETQIVASLDPHKHVEMDSVIRLSVNMKTLHVFDPELEQTLV
jgi:ABC-type sugar transport system ATPase subunit